MGNTKMGGVEKLQNKVREEIQRKFGSVFRFCKITGCLQYRVDYLLRKGGGNEKQVKLLLEICDKAENSSIEGLELASLDRVIIRQAILETHHNLASFCREYPIKKEYLSLIVNEGPRSVKKITPVVKKLCNHLKIKI